MSEPVRPIDILAAGLRHAALRQRVAAGNLANQNTAGYRAKSVEFQDAFKSALDAGRREEALQIEGRLVDQDRPADATGNTVDLENEVLELQDAGVTHRALARLINLSLARQRLAAGGR